MKPSNFVVFLIIVILTISVWGLANRPEVEPVWPQTIQGFSFSPMQLHHNPIQNQYPTPEDIDTDLALLAGKTHAVRTYSMDATLSRIPELAQKHDLNVALGAWLDSNEEKNALQLKQLIQVADKNRRNVVRVMVGNEVLLRKDLTVEQLISYLDHARAELGMPVSTAEPWDIWVKNPQLVEHVDYLAVHMLPFWEGVHLDNAVGHIVNRMNYLKSLYPDKPIVIAEVGWPSRGRTFKKAEASVANQATFLRRFLKTAEQENYIYYVMEAFDQPWKQQLEGSIGAYWGVYNAKRSGKI